MKKTISGFIMFMCIGILVLCPENVPAAENSETNAISSVTGLSYIGEKRFYTPFFYEEPGHMGMRSVEDQGILGCLSLDYDSDGTEELLAVTYEASAIHDDMKSVRLSMYEEIGEQWQIADQVELLREQYDGYVNDLSSLYSSFPSAFEGDLFVRNCNGQYQLFYENAYYSKYFSTGSGWNFIGYTYDGSQFCLIENTRTLWEEGSGFETDCLYELDKASLMEFGGADVYVDMIEQYQALGFASERIGYGNSTVSQDPYSYLIVRLVRGDNYNEEAASEWMSAPQGELEEFWIDVEDHTGELPEELQVFQWDSDSTVQAKENSLSAGEAEDVQMNDYIIPDSDTIYLTQDQLISMGLDKAQLRLARNEIFARHGRIFTAPELQEYFQSKIWYVPQYSPEEFDAKMESMLNATEISNIQVIKALEEIMEE